LEKSGVRAVLHRNAPARSAISFVVTARMGSAEIDLAMEHLAGALGRLAIERTRKESIR
jgi:hypothetical protein